MGAALRWTQGHRLHLPSHRMTDPRPCLEDGTPTVAWVFPGTVSAKNHHAHCPSLWVLSGMQGVRNEYALRRV